MACPPHARKGVGAILVGLRPSVVACTQPQPRPADNDGDTTTVELNQYPIEHDSLSSVVFSREEIYGELMHLEARDSFLIATDRHGDPFVHVVDAATGKLIKSMGRHGAGPGEFAGFPFVVAGADTASRLWLFETSGQRLVRLDLISLSFVQPGAAGSWTVRLAPRYVYAVAVLGSSLVGAVDSMGHQRLAAFDTTGLDHATLVTISYADDRLPRDRLSPAYHHPICVRPSGDRVGFGYVNAGLVQLVDLEQRTTTDAAVPFRFRPQFSPHPATGQPIWASGSTSRRAYGDCAATATHFVAIFSGRLRRAADYNAWPKRYTSWVHFFTWDGTLDRVLRLDHYATSLALDPQGRYIYTIAEDSTGFRLIRRTPIAPQ